jgi:kynurenine formamidase
MTPRYAELPNGDAKGVFGPDDVFGSLNRLTEKNVVAATKAVRSGKVFSLNAPVDWPNPGLFGRNVPEHRIIDLAPGTFDDRLDGYYPQGSSQWDSFRHTHDLEIGGYNGKSPESLGIERWAQRGIVGHGVLLDVASFLEAAGRPLTFDRPEQVTVADLQDCASSQGTTIRDGDILLVRVGWTTGYENATAIKRQEMVAALEAPGLSPGHDMAELLWDWGIAAVATDGPALEAFPIAGEFLHHKLLGRLGIPIGELWWLDELADDCSADGTYDFLFTSAPIHVKGGVGSPANALAIK